jgi:hypothetical protein
VVRPTDRPLLECTPRMRSRHEAVTGKNFVKTLLPVVFSRQIRLNEQQIAPLVSQPTFVSYLSREDTMWEDNSYCWVVTCKNHIYHFPRNFIYRHKIPLAEADAVTSRPPINQPFRVRCDMCGKEYSYKPSDILRIEKELPESFTPHPLFRGEQACRSTDT